jgi:hypothetical protein
MSWNKANLDVKTGKVTYEPMTAEEIAEAQARIAAAEAAENASLTTE